MSKEKSKYTTIQVRTEINNVIRQFCKERGLVASTITERYWVNYISSSMSGSVLV